MANVTSYLFTSEFVTEGHPDKVCDQISDAILAKEIELAKSGYVAPDGNPADPAQVRVACSTPSTTSHPTSPRTSTRAGRLSGAWPRTIPTNARARATRA